MAIEGPLVPPRGVRCPSCGCAHLPVVWTRRRASGRVLRGRECRHCGRRVTTSEQVEPRATGGPTFH